MTFPADIPTAKYIKAVADIFLPKIKKKISNKKWEIKKAPRKNQETGNIKSLGEINTPRFLFCMEKNKEKKNEMPNKPAKPCAYPGCPKLTEKTYCPEHEKEMIKRYETNDRDPLHGKRYGRNWQRVRSAYVAAHPLCERCARQGRYIPVEEVHHVVPLRDGGTNDWNNLVSLCRKCHAEVHAEMGDRRSWKRPPQGEVKSL